MAKIRNADPTVHSLCGLTELDRRCRTPSIRGKAISPQYLLSQEEEALVAYVLRSAENGFLLPIKALRRLALVTKRRRYAEVTTPVDVDSIKPPGKNLSQALASRHPDLTVRRLKQWTGQERTRTYTRR